MIQFFQIKFLWWNKGEFATPSEKIDEKFHGKVSTFISAEQCLDVMPPNISKGSAISVLLKEFQLQPEEVACIGILIMIFQCFL